MVITFKDYLFDLDDNMVDITNNDISKTTPQEFVTKQLKIIDCEKNNRNSLRLRQTIDYTYKTEFYRTLYCIKRFFDDEEEQNHYYDLLIKQHNANLEYEKIVPPIVYKKTKQTNNDKSKTNKREPKTESKPKHKLDQNSLVIPILKLKR